MILEFDSNKLNQFDIDEIKGFIDQFDDPPIDIESFSEKEIKSKLIFIIEMTILIWKFKNDLGDNIVNIFKEKLTVFGIREFKPKLFDKFDTYFSTIAFLTEKLEIKDAPTTQEVKQFINDMITSVRIRIFSDTLEESIYEEEINLQDQSQSPFTPIYVVPSNYVGEFGVINDLVSGSESPNFLPDDPLQYGGIIDLSDEEFEGLREQIRLVTGDKNKDKSGE